MELAAAELEENSKFKLDAMELTAAELEENNGAASSSRAPFVMPSTAKKTFAAHEKMLEEIPNLRAEMVRRAPGSDLFGRRSRRGPY